MAAISCGHAARRFAGLLQGGGGVGGHGSTAVRVRMCLQASSSGKGGKADEEGGVGEGGLEAYERGIADGSFRRDERQREVSRALQALLRELQALSEERVGNEGGQDGTQGMGKGEGGGGSLGWLRRLVAGSAPVASDSPSSPRGLYLYGGVGTGKTMLVDMFAEACSSLKGLEVCRRHFHDFMLSVHSLLQKEKNVQDPLVKVATSLSPRPLVLCLDEFFVTDVADAMILARLFKILFERGTVLVATSNRVPEKLYEGGLQRALFLPFIDLLNTKCIVHDIDSMTDYRKLGIYCGDLYRLNTDKHAAESWFEKMVKDVVGEDAKPLEIDVMMGRKMLISRAGKGCAVCSFEELCEKPVAAADYIALGGEFHTILIENIPIFKESNKSSAYRFVTLIDILYENRARFICTAEGSPVELFQYVMTLADYKDFSVEADADALKGVIADDNLGFTKDRTVSRLIEMQTNDYLKAHTPTQE